MVLSIWRCCPAWSPWSSLGSPTCILVPCEPFWSAARNTWLVSFSSSFFFFFFFQPVFSFFSIFLLIVYLYFCHFNLLQSNSKAHHGCVSLKSWGKEPWGELLWRRQSYTDKCEYKNPILILTALSLFFWTDGLLPSLWTSGDERWVTGKTETHIFSNPRGAVSFVDENVLHVSVWVSVWGCT